MRCETVTQVDPEQIVFSKVYGDAVASLDLDRLDVAVAYMTRSGLPILKDTIGRDVTFSRWVIGVDDLVTEPKALKTILDLDGSEVKVASSGSPYRFHPKIYLMWSSTRPELCVSYVGSANFTRGGLVNNTEAGVVLISENIEDAELLKSQWQSFWDMGLLLDQDSLDRYKAKYKLARKARSKLDASIEKDILGGEAIIEVIIDDAVLLFDGQPNTANVAWLECASPSAGGRDLEFPAAVMPFFRLTGERAERRFRTLNGHVFDLVFTMRQDNQMWRLLFSSESIMSAIGRQNLRPLEGGGNRSDLAVVFVRSNVVGVDFDVEMVVIGSREHANLITQSQDSGILQRTRGAGGRNFGYF